MAVPGFFWKTPSARDAQLLLQAVHDFPDFMPRMGTFRPCFALGLETWLLKSLHFYSSAISARAAAQTRFVTMS